MNKPPKWNRFNTRVWGGKFGRREGVIGWFGVREGEEVGVNGSKGQWVRVKLIVSPGNQCVVNKEWKFGEQEGCWEYWVWRERERERNLIFYSFVLVEIWLDLRCIGGMRTLVEGYGGTRGRLCVGLMKNSDWCRDLKYFVFWPIDVSWKWLWWYGVAI